MKSKIVIIVALALMPFGKGIYAQTEIQNAEAIFIYNFLSQIQWPEETLGNSYVVGVLGKTSTYDYLLRLTTNRKIGKRSIEVKHFSSANEISNCQVLLVAHNKSNDISTVKKKLNGRSCLIIGQKSSLTESGAVIAFNVVDGKLRYRINKTNAKQQNLLISSAIMQMALK